MNKQELFDKVAVHLIKQGKKSANGQFCKYRGTGGLRCAVGCLIPDRLYTRKIEGTAISDVIDGVAFSCDINYSDPDVKKVAKYMAELLPTKGVRDLADLLQSTHDCCAANQWADGLSEAAQEYGLSEKKLKAAIANKKKKKKRKAKA